MINRIRVPLGFVLSVPFFYFADPRGVSLLAGFPLALFGILFRVLAAGTIRKDTQLATAGPYSITRNPLYFGTLLMVIGLAVMSASLASAALILIPWILIYPPVIRNEEAHLENLFSENFRSYKRKVPALFPKLEVPSMESFSFRQYLANKEYNVVLGFAAVLALFILKWRWS
jgi:protein-S-isoprenylcysteine O-methyltransferase Ste14